MSDKGTLYLIPVPLSYAEISQMALESVEIAKKIKYFIAERPKTCRKWLKDLNHPLPQSDIEVIEWKEPLEAEFQEKTLDILNSGQDLALVSEAGMPCIADPGYPLVRFVHSHQFRVVPLSGPNAMLQTLMASGLSGQHFCFHGYLPAKKEELREAIIKISKLAKSSQISQIFMETPYRNKQVFASLLSVCPQDLVLAVGAGIGSTRESILSATISQWKSIKLNPFLDIPAVFILGSK